MESTPKITQQVSGRAMVVPPSPGQQDCRLWSHDPQFLYQHHRRRAPLPSGPSNSIITSPGVDCGVGHGKSSPGGFPEPLDWGILLDSGVEVPLCLQIIGLCDFSEVT